MQAESPGCLVAADLGQGSGFQEALGDNPRQTSGTVVVIGLLSSEGDERGRSHALVQGEVTHLYVGRREKRDQTPCGGGGEGEGQRSMTGWAGLWGIGVGSSWGGSQMGTRDLLAREDLAMGEASGGGQSVLRHVQMSAFM